LQGFWFFHIPSSQIGTQTPPPPEIKYRNVNP
jgi:hypothetical protein